MITAADIKNFEDDIEKCFLDKQILAPVHLSGGDEQIVIDLFEKYYQKGDWLFLTWRGHSQCLAAGVDPAQLKADILAGKSMSLCYKDPNIFTSAIVAGIFPQALGVAWGLKAQNSPNKVIVWAGDASCSTGTFNECLRYAENFDLPILFVVSDNDFSVGSPTMETWGYKDKEDQKRQWNSSKIVYYHYTFTQAHVGSNKGWVTF
jgi:pyruvate dehydrogenase E1 component alpha subunit